MQALIGLAFGREGSNAAFEHGETLGHFPWKKGDLLHAVAVLTDPSDAVEIVPPPFPLDPTVMSATMSLSPSAPGGWRGRATGGGDEEWFGCVRESVELLSAVANRELPRTFVAKQLLPRVIIFERQKHFSVFF